MFENSSYSHRLLILIILISIKMNISISIFGIVGKIRFRNVFEMVHVLYSLLNAVRIWWVVTSPHVRVILVAPMIHAWTNWLAIVNWAMRTPQVVPLVMLRVAIQYSGSIWRLLNSIWLIVLCLSRVGSCMPSGSDRAIPLLDHICSISESAPRVITIIVDVDCTITTDCMNKGFFAIIIISIHFLNLLDLSNLHWPWVVHSRSVYWNCFKVSDGLDFMNCAWPCQLNSLLRTKMCPGRIDSFGVAFIYISDSALIFLKGGRDYLSSGNISGVSDFSHFIGILDLGFIRTICCCPYCLRYRCWVKSHPTFRWQFHPFGLWKGF